jgi:hypothetical protein
MTTFDACDPSVTDVCTVTVYIDVGNDFGESVTARWIRRHPSESVRILSQGCRTSVESGTATQVSPKFLASSASQTPCTRGL